MCLEGFSSPLLDTEYKNPKSACGFYRQAESAYEEGKSKIWNVRLLLQGLHSERTREGRSTR
jgi:hypothetical protein